jgi:hypothetical protein
VLLIDARTAAEIASFEDSHERDQTEILTDENSYKKIMEQFEFNYPAKRKVLKKSHIGVVAQAILKSCSNRRTTRQHRCESGQATQLYRAERARPGEVSLRFWNRA